MSAETGLARRPQVFIGGNWATPLGGSAIEVRSPATGEQFGSAWLGGPEDIDAAVSQAAASFAARTWRDTPAAERAAVLRGAADWIEARKDAAIDVLTRELGCPRWFAERAHVPNPIRNLRYYADLIEQLPMSEVRSDGVNRSLVCQEPAGVVAAISPWNGPLSTPTIKVGPALAAGCSVVLKPPPETPLSAYLLADGLAAAGLPAGVLSIVPGGREVGEHLVRHPGVDKVAFTGSTAAGRRIMAICAGRIARVTLELGGKSAAIVLADADITAAVRALIPMIMMVNGQACIAQSRIVVARERAAELTDALAAGFAALKVGDPFDPATDVGPLVSEAQRRRVEGYLDVGLAEGAHLVGGGRPGGLEQEFFVNPAVLTGVDNCMRVAQEEIFGPVAAVIAFDTVDDAIAIANDSQYGLSGSVWSADTDAALTVARRIRTGMVSINGAPQAFGTPFGGFKQSGVGREMGPEGLRSYLEPMSIAIGAG